MTGPATSVEWAMGSTVSSLVYPQADEDTARSLVEFYLEHYPDRRPIVVRRVVTVGPWEAA